MSPAAWLLVLSVLLPTTPCRSEILAWDDANEDNPYATDESFNYGQNGGAGFTDWVLLDTGSTHGQHYLVEPGLDSDVFWGMQGTHAMGRGLQTALPTGSWTFRAIHNVDNPANSGFSGFTLKPVNSPHNSPLHDPDLPLADELLRFGFNRQNESDEGHGIMVSTDGGVTYAYHDCGWSDDGDEDLLEYTVSWDGLGHYALRVNNLTEGVMSLTFRGAMTAGPVAMFGFAIYGGTYQETIAFDSLTVVPEPTATLAALLLVPAAAFVRRRNLRRRA